MLNKTTTTAARTEICRRAILEVSTESFLQVVWSVEFGFCEGIMLDSMAWLQQLEKRQRKQTIRKLKWMLYRRK